MTRTDDWRGVPPEIEMAVVSPDDREELGFWPWAAAFLLGGGVGFICGMQLTMWALSPVAP